MEHALQPLLCPAQSVFLYHFSPTPVWSETLVGRGFQPDVNHYWRVISTPRAGDSSNGLHPAPLPSLQPPASATGTRRPARSHDTRRASI